MSSVSDNSRLAGTTTVTAAVAFADPEVAVIVAVPSTTAVTNPVEDTVAAVPVAPHDTLAPLIVAPFWSLTVAVSCDVSPNASRLTLVGDTEIEVATGAGGTTGAVVLSPHARSKSTAESRM